MKKVLPLLARPEYYNRLKSGKARGGEAVIMVENIRIYADILNRYEAPHRPPEETGGAKKAAEKPGLKLARAKR
jgi:membrane-bound lytic murein transglycosylase F